ncbi:PH domain-containing protein [Actinoplanes sp. NPDC051346]|uniref:PH domain-containing protein n=1 Tax=Actinoplanes sp. NPDC051346 TaxID=3155048 RepID=UPI003441244E
MGNEWVRPYSVGTGRWLVIGWEAVAFGLLGWASIGLFELTGVGIRVLAVLMAAVWVIAGWRILEMGVYVSPGALRIRGLLRTRTLRWDDIAHVRLHRHANKIGRWELEGGMTVLIERRDGSTVNTELWAQGVDFHRRPQLFREVYHELRNRHLAFPQRAEM